MKKIKAAHEGSLFPTLPGLNSQLSGPSWGWVGITPPVQQVCRPRWDFPGEVADLTTYCMAVRSCGPVGASEDKPGPPREP